MWVSSRRRAPAFAIESLRPVSLPVRRHAVAIVIIALATAALAAAVLPGAAWGFSDDDVFILYYLRGRAYTPPVWSDSGRFFPLGHQEWRLLYFWTQDVALYHAFGLLQYAAFGLGVYALLRALKASSALALAFALTLPPVVVAFATLVVQERTQVLFLPWFLFALIKWDSNQRFRYALLAFVCGQLMLYTKEPSVLFVLPVALLRLATPAGQAAAAIRARNQGLLRRVLRCSAADVLVLGSCLAFLAIYFSAVSFDTLFSDRVYDGRSLRVGVLPSAFAAWAGKEPLLLLMLCAGVVRLGARLQRRQAPDLRDQILVGAVAYFASLVSSGLVSTYYGALPMAAAAIALSPGALPAGERRRLPAFLVGSALALGIGLNVFFATPHLLYEQDWTARNATLTAELERALSQEQGQRRVFLRGHSWDAEMLAVYANGYRRLGAVFLIADPRYEGNQEEDARNCNTAANLCLAYSPAPPEGALTVDLGVLEHSRSASLVKGTEVLWRYQDRRLHDFLSVTPPFLRGALRHFYNFW